MWWIVSIGLVILVLGIVALMMWAVYHEMTRRYEEWIIGLEKELAVAKRQLREYQNSAKETLTYS